MLRQEIHYTIVNNSNKTVTCNIWPGLFLKAGDEWYSVRFFMLPVSLMGDTQVELAPGEEVSAMRWVENQRYFPERLPKTQLCMRFFINEEPRSVFFTL